MTTSRDEGFGAATARPRWARPGVAAMLLALILAPASALAAPPSEIIGTAAVIDGDTIEVGGTKVRLNGIDAPEAKQTCQLGGLEWPCGRNASLSLSRATAGQPVTCRGTRTDRYGRLVATCYVGDIDLNARMVREGWALAFRKYSKAYVADESEARANARGLWRGQFLEPWEWRKQAKAAH